MTATRRFRLRWPVALLLLAAVVSVAGVALQAWLEFSGLELDDDPERPGALVQVAPLVQKPWESAETGWIAIGGAPEPRVNANFAGAPLRVAGREYATGIGVFPTSEVVYRLDGAYQSLRFAVGVDDAMPAGSAPTRFLVFGDGVKLFESRTLVAGERPQPGRVTLQGVSELRLVALDESGGTNAGFANWLRPQIRQRVALAGVLAFFARAEPGLGRGGGRARLTPPETSEQGRAARAVARRREEEALRRAALALVRRAAAQPGGPGTGVRSWRDAEQQQMVLDNGVLIVAVSTQQDTLGALSVVDRGGGPPRIHESTPSFEINGIPPVVLARDARLLPSEVEPFAPVADAALGLGLRLTQRYWVERSQLAVDLEWTLYQEGSYLTWRAIVEGAPVQAGPARFHLFDVRRSQIAAEESLQYVTDYGRPRHVRVLDDGIERADTIGEGKPLFLWSAAAQRLVIADLEPADAPATVVVQLAPGRAQARLGYATGARFEGGALLSPLVLLDLPGSSNPVEALRNFREVSHALHPPLLLPAWSRFEWNSWYAYFMDISDEVFARQVAYIAQNLADLGPWQMSIDAGWNVAEGREGGDWRTVDEEKFPEGIAAVVAAAHAAGVRSTLYFSAPYVDTRARPVNWLGLPQLVEQHPEWLIKVDQDEAGEGFVYDFSHPGFRQYLRDLLRTYFLTYRVDGIELDGLGTVPTVLNDGGSRSRRGLSRAATQQTMDIYRFIHDTVRSLRADAYIYAGWHAPIFANPFSHAFWYSDEYPGFSNPYPYGGLKEHVEYAMLQQGVWGQRSHMGFAYGDPNENVTARWWLEASIALGSHIALGFDLPAMSNSTLSLYRERLAHYRPFQGEPFVVGEYPPEVFGSHRDGFTYLGLLNSRNTSIEHVVDLAAIGLDPGVTYTLLDAEAGRYGTVSGQVRLQVPPQSFRFLVLRATTGVFWSNSSYREALSPGQLLVDVSGPDQISGYVDMIVPRPERVWVDGVELDVQSEDLAVEWTAVYFEETGILSVRYPHDAPHRVRVLW